MKVIFITRRWIILFWVLLGIALFLLYALKLRIGLYLLYLVPH